MPGTRWRDLRLRVASALVLAPIGVASIWIGGWPYFICLTLLTVGMGWEWAQLVERRADARYPWGHWLVGCAYIGPAFISLLILRTAQDGRATVLFLMLVVWASDIGAYLVGRLIGGPRLAPLISPGKTWSGAAGGLLCAALIGLAYKLLGAWHAIALALLLSVVEQAGDLLESAIKRHFGAKDSGAIIPGHGGLLDRLDGVLAAAPAALLWFLAAGPGHTIWH